MEREKEKERKKVRKKERKKIYRMREREEGCEFKGL